MWKLLWANDADPGCARGGRLGRGRAPVPLLHICLQLRHHKVLPESAFWAGDFYNTKLTTTVLGSTGLH